MKLGTASHNHHEIIVCRGSNPALVAESARSADGHAVTRWNSDDLVPPKAREVCLSARATIAAFTGIDESLFSISVQTQATDGACGTGEVYGGLALLLSSDDGAQVARARAVASDFAAVLGKPPEVPGDAHSNPAEPTERDATSSKPLGVDDLVSASFLGARIQIPLDLVVPGHIGYQVQGRFKRRESRSFDSRKLTVRGHLRWIKVGGKTNRVFMNATDVETKRPFGNHPILFHNRFRESLAQALANPGAPLQLMIVEQQLDDGRSRPRIKYLVESVDLAYPDDSRQDILGRCDSADQMAVALGTY